jgi:hypothetical protein
MMDIYLSVLTKTEVSEVETVVLATFDRLIALATTDSEILAPILKWTLTRSGNIAFDKVTGSTIVQRCRFLGTFFVLLANDCPFYELYEGKSAASFCLQVAAWISDMLCNFYLVIYHKIADNNN